MEQKFIEEMNNVISLLENKDKEVYFVRWPVVVDPSRNPGYSTEIIIKHLNFFYASFYEWMQTEFLDSPIMNNSVVYVHNIHFSAEAKRYIIKCTIKEIPKNYLGDWWDDVKK